MLSIEDLPNEIIYRIFNKMDTFSIISFCSICKRFVNCLKNYNSFQMNFDEISKEKFHLLCRLINPSNIIKLRLSDNDNKTPGQIKSFIKNYQIEKLIRLKSFELIQIDENDLENLLKPFLKSSLNDIHIEYRQYFGMLNFSTIKILHEILSLKTLKKVHLDMRSYQTDSIQWPSSTTIENLILCHLNLNQFIQMINKPNRYQSIILRNFIMKDFDLNYSKKLIYLKEMKLFQIEESELFMEKIQWLISYMSNLIDLKLEGFTRFIEKIFQNNQLENFIQMNLIYLKTLIFFIRFSPVEFKINDYQIDSLIQQFQRTFWISKLNCFVSCDFIQDSNELHFYSIPSSFHYFKYSDQLTMISKSTLTNINYLNERFHSIYYLDLNLKDLQISLSKIKNFNEDSRLFPNLINLKLTINDQTSLNSFEYLSKLIYFEKLIEIVLIISSRSDQLDIIIRKFLSFLKNFSNLNSLEIFNRWYGIFSFINIKSFCTMIPKNIKYLNIDISDMNQIQSLIEQLQFISSFKFKFSFDKANSIQKILDWLKNQNINSTYISDMHYLSIWISRQSNKTNSNKRIKLDH